jgi:hypothetical protein
MKGLLMSSSDQESDKIIVPDLVKPVLIFKEFIGSHLAGGL